MAEVIEHRGRILAQHQAFRFAGRCDAARHPLVRDGRALLVVAHAEHAGALAARKRGDFAERRLDRRIDVVGLERYEPRRDRRDQAFERRASRELGVGVDQLALGVLALDLGGRASGENPQDAEVTLLPVLWLGRDHGEVAVDVARRVLERDRQISPRAHTSQFLALGGKQRDHVVVVGDDVAAENALARRALERIIEALLQLDAIPEREHVHARIVVAEL
jgi:hypothetical protein